MTEVYYAGFDPGSGEATLTVWQEGGDPEGETMTVASLVADGRSLELLKRGDHDATLADVLREGEYVLSMGANEYFLGDAVFEGFNETDALGDPNRYWSNHSRILLLTLACTLIPEQAIELRLVTGLPFTLYERENRVKVMNSLAGYYRCNFAEKGQQSDREIVVKVGYVAVEGQGILVHCGEVEGDQAVFDIGERTFDLIVANGQQLTISKCAGEEIGVGLIVDDLKEYARRHRRVIDTVKAHEVLKAYVSGESLPKLGSINADDLFVEIGNSIQRAGRVLKNFIGQTLTNDGEDVAAGLDRVYLAGGGAYYYRDLVYELIGEEKVIVVAEPELGNALGFCELAQQLENRKADIWETRTYGR